MLDELGQDYAPRAQAWQASISAVMATGAFVIRKYCGKPCQAYNFKLAHYQAFIRVCDKREDGDTTMTRFLMPVALCVTIAGAALPALAQNFSNLPLRNPRQPSEGYISVQSGISLSFPVADGDSEEQQEKVLKSFYKVAASGCAILLDSIADACEISAMSSSTAVNNLDSRGSRLSINGQVTMAVKLKPSTAAAK